MGQGAGKAGVGRWPLLAVPEGADIAGFTVEELLGAGASGAVYRAQRGGARFALKLQPLEGLAGWAEREVSILLRLKHPNVVGFRACGTWPDLAPRGFYLAMELVEGRPLHLWMQEEPLDARRVLLLLRGLARGLAVVHAAGVLHRDIKESNIVVRASDGEPVLVDFGVGDYPGAPRLTQGVLPPGTPPYRSPEALTFREAHWRQPEARYTAAPTDDLFALGVVLYRVLTRQYPFPDVEFAGAAALKAPPVPPHEANPLVPGALSTLCLRLLSTKPEERGSAQALLKEVESLLTDADTGWELPLHEGFGPPSRPAPSEDSGALAAEGHVGRPPARFRRWPRVVVLVGLGMCLTGGLARMAFEDSEARPGPPEAGVTVGREVAHSALGPEPATAAPPPLAVSTSAATAPAVSQQESDMPVQTTPPTSDTLTPASSGGWGPLGRALVTAATCTGLACSSGPQVRPPPRPESCPPSAVETMRALGIEVDDEQSGSATFTTPEQDSGVLTVRDGPVQIRVGSGLGRLDNGKASGRLFVSERVYGYFDRATTRDGQSYPVCLIMRGLETRKRGVPREPGDSSPDSARIDSEVALEAVERFE